MKIKGEYKIELRDAKTGKVTDTRIGHNFVTDFTQEQFRHYGGRQPQSAYSLDDFFGGIMCFDSAINENTDTSGRHEHPLFAPASKNMTANGCIAYSESSASATEIGAYNASESVENTGRSRRYVYDWDTNEGNGVIGCVALTSAQGGWKGVGNKTSGGAVIATNNKVGYQYHDFNYRGGLLNFGSSSFWSDRMSKIAYIKGNKVGIVYSINDVTGTSITIREYDLTQTTRNPFNGNGNFFEYARYIETTYTLQSMWFDGNSEVGVGCQKGYWYVIRRQHPNSAGIWIDIINNDGTQEAYTFNVPSSLDARQGNGVYFSSVVKKNGYIFLSTGYNYDGGANIWVWMYNIATQELTYKSVDTDNNSNTWYRMYLIDLEDTIYSEFFILKFVSGVPTFYRRNASSRYNGIGDVGGRYLQDLYDEYSIWLDKTGTNQSISLCASGLPDIWLATIANLSQPVVKTADKTMKITYTLTLVEE